MDDLIEGFAPCESIQEKAKQFKLPARLDIYDIAELYAPDDEEKQKNLRVMIVEAYMEGYLKATKGLRKDKILPSFVHKTENRNGVWVVLPNENEIIIYKNDFKEWLRLNKIGKLPLKNCLLANWWKSDEQVKTSRELEVHPKFSGLDNLRANEISFRMNDGGKATLVIR